MVRQNMNRPLRLFLRFSPYLLAALPVLAVCVASRVGGVDVFSSWPIGRAFYEHIFGGAAFVVALFGVFSVFLYPSKNDAREPLFIHRIVLFTPGSAWVAHLSWELGQAYCPYIARQYNLPPRGFIQWDQVAADFAGVVIGYLILRNIAKRVIAAEELNSERPASPHLTDSS